MNYELFHAMTFNVLYGCIGLLVFVILERAIYYTYVGWRMQRLNSMIDRSNDLTPPALRTLDWSDPVSQAIIRYSTLLATGVTRERQEDLSSALFIRLDKKVSGRLWILDTVVTAAPLLGLLGTLFGIMQTFDALAAGGVSDPAAVSRGIGTALVATAIGIGTALLGLLGNNMLGRRAHLLMEDFKSLLLGLSAGSGATAVEASGHAALSTPVVERGMADR